MSGASTALFVGVGLVGQAAGSLLCLAGGACLVQAMHTHAPVLCVCMCVCLCDSACKHSATLPCQACIAFVVAVGACSEAAPCLVTKLNPLCWLLRGTNVCVCVVCAASWLVRCPATPARTQEAQRPLHGISPTTGIGTRHRCCY